MNFKSLLDFFRPWKRNSRQSNSYQDSADLPTIIIQPEDISSIIFDEEIYIEPDDELMIVSGEREEISAGVSPRLTSLLDIVADTSERTEETIRCPYCQESLQNGLPLMECPTCKTLHHHECWQVNDGCTTYGCDNSPSE